MQQDEGCIRLWKVNLGNPGFGVERFRASDLPKYILAATVSGIFGDSRLISSAVFHGMLRALPVI